MANLEKNSAPTWLSLVAETAGVSGATIARIELGGYISPDEGPTDPRASLRAIVQIHDSTGVVIGATSWEGTSAELAATTAIDLGCDLGASLGSRVVGWIEAPQHSVEPRLARAPHDAAARYFDPTRSMKLMLRAPSIPRALDQEAA
jgi:hypothetical protein